MALRAKHRLRRLAGATAVLFDEERAAADAPQPAVRRPVGGRHIDGPGGLAEAMLHGLQHLPHVYQGTVHPVIVAERRARNRRSRKARRLNRNR